MQDNGPVTMIREDLNAIWGINHIRWKSSVSRNYTFCI